MITLAIIAVVLFALFGLPCGVFVNSTGSQIHARLILCGLRTPIRLKKPAAKAKQAEEKESEPEREPEDWSELMRSGVEVAYRIIDEINQGLFKRISQTRKRFVKVFRFKVHKFFLSIASPDPFITGCTYGAMWAVAPMIQSRFPFEFDGDFESHTPRVDLTASMTFIPAHFLFELIRTLFVLRIFSFLQLKKTPKS